MMKRKPQRTEEGLLLLTMGMESKDRWRERRSSQNQTVWPEPSMWGKWQGWGEAGKQVSLLIHPV